ncbi:MAG: sugar phosphate isomerase/epimerase [Opitutaceae bacterium]|jgi:sugar phosphate isomerase/epimerase|nr:sugar phosphate isomerase/epimerase [Opitutaceae bacterium]
MMLHSFSTLGCAELDLDAVISLGARHGFHALELRALSGTTDLPTLFTDTWGTPARLADHLHQRNMRVCALNTSFSLVGNKPDDRKELLRFADWADGIDALWLRAFDGDRPGASTEELVAEAVETLAWWQAERRQSFRAVDLMVETHGAFVTTPLIQALIKAVPGVRLLWDSHHTWRKGGEDPLATWEAVRPRTVHLHVKDSISLPSEDGKYPYSYVLPGDGEFPMKALREQLRADRFDGVVSLEWERLWHPHLPELDKALHTAARRQWW